MYWNKRGDYLVNDLYHEMDIRQFVDKTDYYAAMSEPNLKELLALAELENFEKSLRLPMCDMYKRFFVVVNREKLSPFVSDIERD